MRGVVADLRTRLRSTLVRRLPVGLRRALRRIVPSRVIGIWTPATRAFDLPLPPQVGADRRTSLRIEAPWSTYIARLLERDGIAGYEAESLATLLACIEVLPAASVFDIGANVGAFSLIAAALTGVEVVGFEPTPELARTFEQMVRLNRLDRVIVEPLALATARRPCICPTGPTARTR